MNRDGYQTREAYSTYADLGDIESGNFQGIIDQLNRINAEYSLADHSGLNKVRYPWSQQYLSIPQFYASRLWEYPWAISHAQLAPGMQCADVGCGESPFTIYLKEIAGCEVLGFDPDIHRRDSQDNFGVSESYIGKTGLKIARSSIDSLEAKENRFDRVFCISVMEHIPDFNIRSKGMKEIARILKPGGMAFITVDVNLLMRFSNPLELIWESGLNLHGGINLTMPESRLGIFCDGKQPADVFGMVLRKDPSMINIHYGDEKEKVEAWRAAWLRDTYPMHSFDSLIRNDLRRNLIHNRTSWLTRLRIASKILLKRYPGI
jgi:2-polyprenyl-3-methyl-5-hydroxy-6-metoxy-1,4-benzoquinol methylase